MQNRHLIVLRFILGLVDVSIVNMSLFVGFYLSNKYENNNNTVFDFYLIITSTLIWLLSTSIFNLYTEYNIYKLTDIYRATWRSMVLYFIVFQFFIMNTSYSNLPENFIIMFYLLMTFGFLLSRVSCIFFEKILKFDINKRKAPILAIASIGGHWTQLLRLMPLFQEHDVTFISTQPTLMDTVKGYKFYSIHDANRKGKLNLIKCTLSVFWLVLISRPRVVVTTGAAPGLIGLIIGKFFGAKTIWVDSMANVEKLSLSGKIAIKIADKVYTQWQHLETPKIMFSGSIL